MNGAMPPQQGAWPAAGIGPPRMAGMRPQGMPGVGMGMGMPGMQAGGMPPGMSQPLQAGMNPAMAQVLIREPQMADS